MSTCHGCCGLGERTDFVIFTKSDKPEADSNHASVDSKGNSIEGISDLGRDVARQAGGHEQGQRACAKRVSGSVRHGCSSGRSIVSVVGCGEIARVEGGSVELQAESDDAVTDAKGNSSPA